VRSRTWELPHRLDVWRRRVAGGRLARRLRVAPPVQLELVSDREGPKPEAVWASLPEQARGAVLVLLARLIGAGAVEQEGEL